MEIYCKFWTIILLKNNNFKLHIEYSFTRLYAYVHTYVCMYILIMYVYHPDSL